MSNTLGNLIGPLYETLSTVSREFVGFLPNVTRDNGNFEKAAVGQTVTAFVVPPATAYSIVPAMVPPSDGSNVFTNFQITLNRSMYVPILWNGEEQRALNNSGPGVHPILLQQFQQAFRTLVNNMEADLANCAYQNASRATGTAGTTPFGVAGDLSDFARSAQILDQNGSPMGTRSIIVNSPAMANIRGKQSVLFKVNESGTSELLRQGSVGEVEGFRIGYTPQIPTVTKGTGTSYVTSGGPYAVGATAITLATGTGTVLQGDVVTFAGDTNQYGMTNSPTVH